MTKNPLTGIANFYEQCVKEQDAKGFSELYKKATKLLFKRIKKELNLDLHFEDVQYLDGYFIFGHGTNSVVHFHIKEAPGWKGGIWWSPIATEETKDKKNPTYETDKLDCDLFFQYEEEIDKFKPSASTFGGSFDFYFEDGCFDSGFMNAYEDLQFIIKEPYLAFYREMHYANFNHEYVSRESAKRYWNRHWKARAEEKARDKLNVKAMYETVKYIIRPMVEDGDAFIYDRGSCISPRYEIVIKNIKLADGKPLVDKEGCYGLFGLGDYPDKKNDEKLWKKTEKECAKRDKCDFYFDNQFSDSCIIRNTAGYNKWLKEAIQENAALFYRKEDKTIFDGEVKSRWED